MIVKTVQIEDLGTIEEQGIKMMKWDNEIHFPLNINLNCICDPDNSIRSQIFDYKAWKFIH